MGRYLLGLDAGNTVIKAVIFDREGSEIASAAAEGHSRIPSPGHVERGLDELWQNARRVIRTCIDEAEIDAGEIGAIGCAGHGNGLYALDRDGRPLLAIQSLDTRAAALVDEWKSQGVGERTYPIGRQRPWPSQTPTLLAWLKRHRPEVFASLGTVFLCKDFIVNRLTGARVSDVSDMTGCGLLNLAGRHYDAALMAAYGLSDSMDLLPPLVESADIAGRLTEAAAAETGLAAGTPVVGGLFDVVASAIGSGVTRTGAASIIAGTWSINQVIIEGPELDGPVFMSSTFDRDRYMAIESSATSAANLEWLVREFFSDIRCEGRSVRSLLRAGVLERACLRRPPLPSLSLRRPTGRQRPGRLLRHRRLAYEGPPRPSGPRRRGFWSPPAYRGYTESGRRLRRGDTLRRRLAQPGMAANIRRRAGRAGLCRALA